MTKPTVKVPRGYQMSEEQQQEWLEHTAALTTQFSKKFPAQYSATFRTKDYKSIKDSPLGNTSSFITPMWEEHCIKAEEFIFSENYDLLSDDILQYAFFFTGGGLWQDKQIEYLEKKWSKKVLENLLLENPYFNPRISSEKYQSSETLINHTTHLSVFEDACQIPISEWRCVVEFGGGYGSMARLIPRFSQHQPYTHVIIDLPIFLTIQDCYLRNCLGKDAVNFCNVDSNEIIPGKINLVSIADDQTLNSLKNLAPTIFIATWSLSETNETTVNKILQLNYCNASYLCFGFRHYEHINPRQPMSDALQIPKGYETLVKSPVFYAGAKEQYYWISKRT